MSFWERVLHAASQSESAQREELTNGDPRSHTALPPCPAVPDAGGRGLARPQPMGSISRVPECRARRQPMGVEDALGHRKVSGAGARAPLTAAARGSRAGGAGAGAGRAAAGPRSAPGFIRGAVLSRRETTMQTPVALLGSPALVRGVRAERAVIAALSGDVQPRRRSPWCRAQDAAVGSLSWGGVAWTRSAVR